MGSSLLVGKECGFAAKRFARLRQLYFSRCGTVAHSSPNRLEIAAKSTKSNNHIKQHQRSHALSLNKNKYSLDTHVRRLL